MSKKQLVMFAVLAVVGTFLLMQVLNRPPQQKPSGTPTTSPTEPAAALGRGGKRLGFVTYRDSQGQQRSKPDSLVLLGSLEPDEQINPYKFQVEIDPRGAGIHTLKLRGVYDTAEHKQELKDKENRTPEKLQDWSYPLLNPVEYDGRLTLPMATRSISVEGKQTGTFQFESKDSQGLGQVVAWEPGQVTTAEDGTQSVDMSFWLYEPQRVAKGEHVIKLVKTYSLARNSDSLRVHLRIENQLPRPQAVSIEQYGPAGVRREDFQKDLRMVCVGKYFTADSQVKVQRKFGIGEAMKEEPGHREKLGENLGAAEPVAWAAQFNKFYSCVFYPIPAGVDPNTGSYHSSGTPLNEKTAGKDLLVPPGQYGYSFYSEVLRETPESNTQAMVFVSDDVNVPAATEADGQKTPGIFEFAYDVYCGPKDREVFNQVPLYDKLAYQQTIDLRSCFCSSQWLTFIVMDVIQWGGRHLHNYGVAIIILVLLVRLALHPLTKKGQVSMMKLSKLGPEIEKLRQKYGDDKEAFGREQFKFMKQQGASPFLGCLPMFLQMPIWIALWTGLQASPSLRHAPLDPWWIKDLAAPDRLIPFGASFYLPMVGNTDAFNLLPLLLAVFMFLQQKLAPMQSAPTAATPEQRTQQKLMQYMMTGMFLLIFYNAPSGLTLYIMASTAGGVLESWVIRKHIKEREAAAAAGETKVEARGWLPRSLRPKKPKDKTTRYQ